MIILKLKNRSNMKCFIFGTLQRDHLEGTSNILKKHREECQCQFSNVAIVSERPEFWPIFLICVWTSLIYFFGLLLLWAFTDNWNPLCSKHLLTLCSHTFTEEHCPNKFVSTSIDYCPYVPLAASDNPSRQPVNSALRASTSKFLTTKSMEVLLRLKQQIHKDR